MFWYLERMFSRGFMSILLLTPFVLLLMQFQCISYRFHSTLFQTSVACFTQNTVLPYRIWNLAKDSLDLVAFTSFALIWWLLRPYFKIGWGAAMSPGTFQKTSDCGNRQEVFQTCFLVKVFFLCIILALFLCIKLLILTFLFIRNQPYLGPSFNMWRVELCWIRTSEF